MICFRGRKNYQRTSENRRRAIKRSRESGFWLARYLLWSVYVFAEWSYIRDSASEKLEDRLGGHSDYPVRKVWGKQSSARGARGNWTKTDWRSKKKEELRQRKEQEICRVHELVNKAEDYRITTEIRNYIQAVMEKTSMTIFWNGWSGQRKRLIGMTRRLLLMMSFSVSVIMEKAGRKKKDSYWIVWRNMDIGNV